MLNERERPEWVLTLGRPLRMERADSVSFLCVVNSVTRGELLLLSYSRCIHNQLALLSRMYQSDVRLLSAYTFDDMLGSYRTIREYMKTHGADLNDSNDPKLLRIGPELFERAALACS